MGKPLTDLFASRASSHLTTYIAWRRDLHCVATRAFSISWNKGFLLCISSFLPNNTGSEQEREGQDKKIKFDSTMSADTVVVPPNIENNDKEISNPSITRITTKHSFTNSLSCNKSNSYISSMYGFRGYLCVRNTQICVRKEFLSRQQILSLIQRDRVLYQVMIRPGRSGQAGVIEWRLIYFNVH